MNKRRWAMGAIVALVAASGCTTLRWGAAPNRRDDVARTHFKMGSQTGVTLSDPSYAGEALLEGGAVSSRYLIAARTFAIARFHGNAPEGNDENGNFGAGFGEMLVGGTSLLSRVDVHAGLGYVFAGFTGPRAMIGTTIWAIATDAGGGYAINLELDYYRGSRDREVGVDTFQHLALSVGLELGLGAASFGL